MCNLQGSYFPLLYAYDASAMHNEEPVSSTKRSARPRLQVSHRENSGLAGKLVGSAVFSQLHQVHCVEVADGKIVVCSTGSKLLTQTVHASANSVAEGMKMGQLTSLWTGIQQGKLRNPYRIVYKGGPDSCPSCIARSHQPREVAT
jgi:hypothetical protein